MSSHERRPLLCAESRGALVSLFQVEAGSVEYEAMQGPRKFVEYWRWRYRDPETGRTCRTSFQLSEREAAGLPQAERIEGSMSLREVDPADFQDTVPEVHRGTPGSSALPRCCLAAAATTSRFWSAPSGKATREKRRSDIRGPVRMPRLLQRQEL